MAVANTNTSTPIPVRMPTGVTFTTVGAGFRHSLTLDDGGHAWAWGSDQNGQLGDGGTYTDMLAPVEVSMRKGRVARSVATPFRHHLSPAWATFKALRLLGGAPFLPSRARRRLARIGRLGYVPNDERPRTFNEKLVWLLTHMDERAALGWPTSWPPRSTSPRWRPGSARRACSGWPPPGERLDLRGLPDVSVLKANNDSGKIRVLRQPVPEGEMADLADPLAARRSV